MIPRQCPRCGASGPVTAFPLVPPCHAPPRHDERRRRCLSCGAVYRAWVFVRPPPRVPA